ncbi:alpha/beta hydrolase family esterase [Stenomitos frigidus]|uniref:extracellular catalytic domain type 1 short-chain-length polyhydroxyalkanoate depolymerase n=1 Tax=Stenomitos frigidus TaxID=1886765 RepID=UPI0015E759D8|nr:PHB depolymerase family esterase [Stenomitos frigidus]
MPKHVLIKLFPAALLLGLAAGYHLQPEPQELSKGVTPQSLASPSAQSMSASAHQPAQTDFVGALSDQGQRRTYYLHTPPSYQPGQSLPLVLAFHESEGQGKDMAAHTGLNQLANQKGFLVVYPDGLNAKWNVSEQAATKEDNAAFVQALIAHLGQIRVIDRQRIYATGLSNGGILVQKLACENPGQIAAFATVAALLPEQFQAKCQSQTPVSMLMINGTADAVVPWQGGAPPAVHVGRNLSIPSIPDVFSFWQKHNGCSAPVTVQQRADKRVTTSSYTHCQSGSDVTLMALNGASHIWPGGGYGQSSFLDTSQTIWSFFERHTLATAALQPNATKGQSLSASQ